MDAVTAASAAVAHTVATNASDNMKQHFRFLYEEFLKSVRAGKPFLCVPQVVGQQIGTAALEGMANRFCIMVQEKVYIIFHPVANAYLIGPADNLPFTPVSVMYIANYRAKIINPSCFKPKDDPKTANCFILYRKWRQEALKTDQPNLTAAEISKAVSELWKKEDDIVKAHFKKLAEHMRESRRARLALRNVTNTSSTPVVQQPLPEVELFLPNNPSNQAFAQTLPLLDPKIEKNEALIDRFTSY